jgi:4-amino-4-deoxy-L-arabinose transferase-like glycosyltransferase
MDPFWQVIIGSGIGGLLLEIYLLYKSYARESAASNESQRMAKASIIFGLSGIILIFIGSIVGIILGLISMRGKKHKGLSIIGIIISFLTLLPWLMVLILGQ